jgi:hypothetical protein
MKSNQKIFGPLGSGSFIIYADPDPSIKKNKKLINLISTVCDYLILLSLKTVVIVPTVSNKVSFFDIFRDIEEKI